MPFDSLPNPDVIVDLELLKVLERARELISAGWCKGSLYKKVFGRDAYCLIGSLMCSPARCKAMDHLEDGIRKIDPVFAADSDRNHRFSIENWNDNFATKKKVLAVIDYSIEQVKSGK